MECMVQFRKQHECQSYCKVADMVEYGIGIVEMIVTYILRPNWRAVWIAQPRFWVDMK